MRRGSWSGARKRRARNLYRCCSSIAPTPTAPRRLTGRRSELAPPAAINGGNDYPVKVSTIENPAQRLKDRTHGHLHDALRGLLLSARTGLELVAGGGRRIQYAVQSGEDEALDLRPDLEKLACYLPQQPYVRESRRIVGMKTVVAADMDRFEKAKLWPTSLAMGDYFMDLHHTDEALERISIHEPPRGGGPFQVPFEAFVPEKLDGFLVAEKNLSQSRLVNGATRCNPSPC